MQDSSGKGGTMSSATPTALVAVIVTYNSERHITACLETLLDGTPGIMVMVVDNQSVDRTVDTLKAHPFVQLIINDENVGFARAVNQALALVPEERPVLLLNPDARLAGRDAVALARTLRSTPNLGAVAPLVHQTEDRMQVVHGGRVPTVWRMFTHQSGLARLGNRWPFFAGHYARMKDAKRTSRPLDVDWVSGGCMLISPAARTMAPRLDETWFMYAEDVEYCWRLRRLGFTVRIDPRFEARHEVGGSRDAARRASSEWLLNLYEFYLRDLRAGVAGPFLWRTVVAGGLLARAVVYGIRAIASEGSSVERRHWRRMARDFRAFATDLVRH